MGGKNKADIRIHATAIDGSALNQIYRFAESPAFLGSRVAIMPDVHAGVGCVTGFTADMADTVIIGTGLGNHDYIWSAPHGAGRRFGRGEMKRQFASGEVTMEHFRERMGPVYSTSLSPKTVEESPTAYKSAGDILPDLEATVRIEETMVPVHNLKRHELSGEEMKALVQLKQERERKDLDTNDLDLSPDDITG